MLKHNISWFFIFVAIQNPSISSHNLVVTKCYANNIAVKTKTLRVGMNFQVHKLFHDYTTPHLETQNLDLHHFELFHVIWKPIE